MSSATYDSDSQDRKEKSARIDGAADRLLREYYSEDFEVGCGEEPSATTFDVEHAGGGMSRPNPELLHELDYAGVDKFVLAKGSKRRLIGVAQRFRPERSEGDTDLSLRFPSEVNRLAATLDAPGTLTPAFAFGVVSNYEAVTPEQAFSEFYLLDSEKLIRGIQSGVFPVEGPFTSPGGNKAIYVSLSDLPETSNVFLNRWDYEK